MKVRKDIGWVIFVGLVCVICCVWFCYYNNKKNEECYNAIVQYTINEEYEEALILEEKVLRERFQEAKDIHLFLKTLLQYNNGNINSAYHDIYVAGDRLRIDLAKIQNEQLRCFMDEKLREIYDAHEAYEKEVEKKRQEEQRKKEREEAAELRATGIPYVGMSESKIDKTSLGRHIAIRHNTECISGQIYTANLYDWKGFTARCLRGEVVQVFDGRQYNSSRVSGQSTSKKNSTKPSNNKKHVDAEGFYEDHKDEFDSLEDAEEYLEENPDAD